MDVKIYIPPQQNWGRNRAFVRPIAIIGDIRPVVRDGIDPRIAGAVITAEKQAAAKRLFARRLTRVVGGTYVFVFGMIADFDWFDPPLVKRPVPQGMVLLRKCYPGERQRWTCTNTLNACLFSQNPAGNGMPVTSCNNAYVRVFGNLRTNENGQLKMDEVETWQRLSGQVARLREAVAPLTAETPQEMIEPLPQRTWQPNPNFVRGFVPARLPDIGIEPESAIDPDRPPQFEVEISPQRGLRPRHDVVPRGINAPRPPRTNEREKKTRTRGQAIALALWKMMDKNSEFADMVDQVYEALPKELRHKIEKERGGFWWKTPEGKWKWMMPKRDADQAGQYGISGADWKLAAIWHHWNQVDARKAVEGLAKNEIEDMLYGAAHKAKDRVTFRGRYRRRPF